MAKIYDINFKQKRLNFAYDEQDDRQRQLKQTSYDILELHLREIMQLVIVIAGDDIEFRNYCSRTLGSILANLKARKDR